MGVDVAGGTQDWSEGRGGDRAAAGPVTDRSIACDEDPEGGGTDVELEPFTGGGGDRCGAAADELFTGGSVGDFGAAGAESFAGPGGAAVDKSFCGVGCFVTADVEALTWSLAD